jgi:hypothetical protein
MTVFDDSKLDRGTKILVDDLLLKPQSWSRDEMLSRARKLRYHDYKSDDALCSITLVKHLKSAGFHDLAQNAANGKYDQQKDASDEWAETPEGKAMVQMVENDPALKQSLGATMQALGEAQKSGRLNIRIPNDGPPEPGQKGQA